MLFEVKRTLLTGVTLLVHVFLKNFLRGLNKPRDKRKRAADGYASAQEKRAVRIAALAGAGTFVRAQFRERKRSLGV